MQRKAIKLTKGIGIFALAFVSLFGLSTKNVNAQTTGRSIHDIGAPSQLSFDGDGRGYRFAIVGNKPKPSAAGNAIEPGTYQCVTVQGNVAYLLESVSPNADAITQDGVYFRSEISDTAHGPRLHENTMFLDGNYPNQGYGAMKYMTPDAEQIVPLQNVLDTFKAASITELLADQSVADADVTGFNILANREACEAKGTTPEAIIQWYNQHAHVKYEGDPKDAWIICQCFANPRSWATRGGGFDGQDLDIGLTWRALETCLVVNGTGAHYDEATGAGTFAAWVCKNRPTVQAGNLEKNIFTNTLGFWNETLTPYDLTEPYWRSQGKCLVRGTWIPIGTINVFSHYSGVGIYAFSDGSSSQKITGNTLVEYTAEPGNNAAGNFVTYGQVFKDADKPENGDNASGSSDNSSLTPDTKNFYIWTGQKWDAPTSLANKFACEDLDPRIDLYSLWKAETYYCTPKVGLDMNTMKNAVFKPPLNLGVNWGNILPKEVYSKKLGSAYGLTSVGGKTDLSAVAAVVNGQAGGGSVVKGDLTRKVEGIYENANQAVVDAISRGQAKNYNVLTKTTTGKNVGYGIELIYRTVPIKSTMYTIRLEAGVLQGIDTEIQEYTSGNYGYFGATGDALVAVPNSLAVDVNAVAAACSGATPVNGAAKLFAAVPNVPGAPDGLKVAPVDDVIATGSTNKLTGVLEGYTLYLLQTTPTTPQQSGYLILPDYMTNSVWDNVINWTYQKKHNTTSEYKILCNKNQWCYIYKDIARFTEARKWLQTDCPHQNGSDIVVPCDCWKKHGSVPSPNQTSYWLPNGTGSISDSEKTWKVGYKDDSSGKEVSQDNAHNTEYFMKATKSWDKVRRNSSYLLGDYIVVVDTKNINPQQYRWDYAFNLVRTYNGDKRTISGIHECANEGYATNILGFDVGVKPTHIEKTLKTKDIKTGAIYPAARHSKAEVPVDYETIRWRSQWDLWKSVNGADIKQHDITGEYQIKYQVPDGVDNSTTPPTPKYKWQYEWKTHTRPEYYVEMSKTVLGFTQNGSPKTVVEYQLEKHVQKYLTVAMAIASNTTKQLFKYAPEVPYQDDTTQQAHKIGKVQAHNNMTLAYYPEIIMCGIIPNQTGSSNVEYAGGFRTVPYWIMAEQKRKLHPSSMYFYRMEPIGGSNNVEGFTYSDTMMGSTSYAGGTDKVNIPAGSDIKVVAQPKNIHLQLYGYALDIIDPADGTSRMLNDGGSSYQDIVYSNDNVKRIWGNQDTYTKLFDEFKSWASSMTDPTNYQVDMVLHLKNGADTKVYTNFSTTLGNIKKGHYEEGKCWNIKVQHGSIVHGNDIDNGYERLMKQISKDLWGDESHISEAETIFENSGIWQTIKKAMETDVDPANNAQAVNGDYTGDTLQVDECASKGGYAGRSHWYDESTRTFVIRRFALKDNLFQDILAEDKIDYNSGAKAGGSNVHSYGQNRTTASDGEWFVSIFIKDGVEFMETDTHKSYDPSNVTTPVTDATITQAMQAALDEGRVIIDRDPVHGAEFRVPASTTSNFGD